MSVFFTDTDCEIWFSEVDKYNIKLLEMPYILDGEEKCYDMGKDVQLIEHLYKRMREGAMPNTAALNPQDYTEAFEPIFARGEDIFYIHFSDKLSGTFNYMQTALDELKEKYPDRKITLFNTKSICYGAGMQVLEAAKLHKEGKSDEEILKHMEEFSPHIATEFIVEDLNHLKRGGRLSAAGALFGGLLNIKPIIKVTDEGKLEKIATAKGMKKAISTIVNTCVSKVLKLDEYSICILNADSEELASFAEKLLKEKLGEDVKIVHLPIGPVIGAHCGPGTIGLVYYASNR